MTMRARIARLIDHTLLKPEATAAQVDALIAEAADLNTYSVCVSPSLLPVDVPDDLHVATVCGFPSGAHATSVKAAEAADALAKGAEPNPRNPPQSQQQPAPSNPTTPQ